MLYINARKYNGEDHLLTHDAKKLVDGIKRQLRGFLGIINHGHLDEDSKKTKQVAPIQEEPVKITINTSLNPLVAPRHQLGYN
jgi:hypothetical protein